MQDLFIFKLLFPIFIVLFLCVPITSAATDARDVANLAAREAARKAAAVNDSTEVENRALSIIQGSGKPITMNGVTLFDPVNDVSINYYNGEEVTVTITYRHYLLTPNFLTLIGGSAIGPTLTFTETASFEREW